LFIRSLGGDWEEARISERDCGAWWWYLCRVIEGQAKTVRISCTALFQVVTGGCQGEKRKGGLFTCVSEDKIEEGLGKGTVVCLSQRFGEGKSGTREKGERLLLLLLSS